MRFFGIDLAFSDKNDTGLCVLDETGKLVAFRCVKTDKEIYDFVSKHGDVITVIAIDAPLIVPNKSGQRPCETLVGKLYGKYEASCHSSNLGKPAGIRGPQLISFLKKKGVPIVVSADACGVDQDTWPTIEVYPHTGHIELFQLKRTLKYKKGDLQNRHQAMARYMLLLYDLVRRQPQLKVESVEFLDSNGLENLKGSNLKCLEDVLDALFCAYTAFYLYCHRNSRDRWTVIKGADSEDFITIPRHLQSHTKVPHGVISSAK